MLPLLLKAASVAISNDPTDKRNFLLGAIGVRTDGAIVAAKNGAVISSTYDNFRIIVDAHAECRVMRKLGKNGIIYVARLLKRDGSIAMARPCGGCQLKLKAYQVKKVFYTINPYQYGVLDVMNDRDTVYSANESVIL